MKLSTAHMSCWVMILIVLTGCQSKQDTESKAGIYRDVRLANVAPWFIPYGHYYIDDTQSPIIIYTKRVKAVATGTEFVIISNSYIDRIFMLNGRDLTVMSIDDEDDFAKLYPGEYVEAWYEMGKTVVGDKDDIPANGPIAEFLNEDHEAHDQGEAIPIN